jgi:predicted glycoside hydrolase/deacetylase ChbG (UPF0249 family)
VRRLIVNADDFGVTPGVNRAIVEAEQQGIVTSATMMAGGGAFDDAAEQALSLAQRGARFSVGCHVVLVDGVPLSPPERIPSLLERSNGVAKFRDTLNDFALAALTGKIREQEIEAEGIAQIERIQQAGILPSHVDSHKHAHMFPAVLRPLLRAAKVFGIRAVRNPFGRGLWLPLARVVSDFKLGKRLAQMSALRSFAPGFRREVARQGLRTTDGAFGVLETGMLDLELFVAIASNIPEGTWEFVCHPGYNDSDLDQVRTRLRASRQQELQVLTSPAAREALERRGVELITYSEL